MTNDMMDFSGKVAAAINNCTPILALESNFLVSGLKYPDNKNFYKSLEQSLENKGVSPALIAFMDGYVKVGLNDNDLDRLFSASNVEKTSCGGMAQTLARKVLGATTISSAMKCAHRANIKVLAAGGIGGVHIGAPTSFDISNDLFEMSRAPISIVCSGPKSILDIPKTLEYLETIGVSMIGYKTNIVPSYWSRKSDVFVPIRMDNVQEIALAQCITDKLKLEPAQIIANPIPHEYEIPFETINPIIQDALDQARDQNIRGKDETGFVMSKISKLTAGKTKEATLALHKSNISLASDIAIEVTNLKNK